MASYKKVLEKLYKERDIAKSLYESFQYDAYLVKNSCRNRIDKLNAFMSEQSPLSQNTKSLIEIVLLDVGHEEFMPKAKTALKLYKGYYDSVLGAISHVETMKKDLVRISFEDLRDEVLNHMYGEQFYAGSVYKTMAAWSNNTFQTIEFEGVKLRKNEVATRSSLERMLPLYRNINLYDEDERVPEFNPILLKLEKKSKSYITDVIRPASIYRYEDDNEYRVLRVSVSGQRGALNLIEDIDMIDQMLWNQNVGRPLTFQFGKKLFEKFGYDQKSHTYKANVVFSRCDDDFENPLNFKSHPCISESSFDPLDFLSVFEN